MTVDKEDNAADTRCKTPFPRRWMHKDIDEDVCDDCSIHVSQVQSVEWIEIGISLEVRPDGPETDEGCWMPVHARTKILDRVVKWKYCMGCYADRNGNEGLRRLGRIEWRDYPAFHVEPGDPAWERLEAARERLEKRLECHMTRHVDMFEDDVVAGSHTVD